jgi:hypothetical protein
MRVVRVPRYRDTSIGAYHQWCVHFHGGTGLTPLLNMSLLRICDLFQDNRDQFLKENK